MTPPRLIQVQQNTPEWHAARSGYITASGVADLMTPAKSGKGMGKTAQAYVNKLARARIFGVPDREKPNRNFDRGHALEPIARAAYEEHTGNKVETTGFWLRDLTGDGVFLGASPDGLISEIGILEIKTRWEVAQWDAIMSGEVPEDAMIQIQAQLIATGSATCDYVSFCDGMHLFIKRVEHCPDWSVRITAAVIAGELAIRQAVETYRLKSAGMMLTERIPDADSDFSSLQ
jgi:putative phage-type endonuclease